MDTTRIDGKLLGARRRLATLEYLYLRGKVSDRELKRVREIVRHLERELKASRQGVMS